MDRTQLEEIALIFVEQLVEKIELEDIEGIAALENATEDELYTVLDLASGAGVVINR